MLITLLECDAHIVTQNITILAGETNPQKDRRNRMVERLDLLVAGTPIIPMEGKASSAGRPRGLVRAGTFVVLESDSLGGKSGPREARARTKDHLVTIEKCHCALASLACFTILPTVDCAKPTCLAVAPWDWVFTSSMTFARSSGVTRPGLKVSAFLTICFKGLSPLVSRQVPSACP